MKKSILAALFISSLAASAAFGAAWNSAAVGAGVVGSVHDMTQYTGSVGDSQGRVCAFCHTPHHALTDASLDYNPLWSHTVMNTNYAQYYQSATLDATIDSANLLAGPSRLCMSCHDGVIAVDQHYGIAGNKTLTAADGFGQAGIAQTNQLGNDHPIGFDYIAVAGDTVSGGTGTDTGIKAATEEYATNNGVTIQSRLFAGTIMTCATCHDVHNKKNKDVGATNYLLLAPNTDSALCTSCHVK